QKVILNKYAGTEVKLGQDEFVIVKQSDILAIVE
ncbi:MAG: co-chaperone GroES, partial [Clostridia bacterium]|nr:co-chaperone GroES [Clostridia bacterium]